MTGITVQHYNESGSEWNAYVYSHHAAANYHQYGWRNVLEKSFGHQVHYLTARNGRNEICGILPLVQMKSAMFGNFLVSLPFFNYSGILCSSEEATVSLLEKSRSMLRETGSDHVELRHMGSFEDGLVTKTHKVTMILDLEKDEDRQWKGLDAKVRNQVRKAEKSGLRTETGHLGLLDGFYDVFSRNMRDLGTPVYGKNFFRNILEIYPDTTKIVSVVMAGKPIASCLLTWYRDTLEIPWASSVRDFKELCPNTLLFWSAIRFAVQNGFSKFDFGRSTQGEGSYRFKKHWGARQVQLYWQYLLDDGVSVPELNPANPKYRMAIKMWQHLPVPVTNILGPRIVRNIP